MGTLEVTHRLKKFNLFFKNNFFYREPLLKSEFRIPRAMPGTWANSLYWLFCSYEYYSMIIGVLYHKQENKRLPLCSTSHLEYIYV